MLCCFTAAWQEAIAQPEKIDTDRPDQTESPYTVPKKWIQFEAGFNRQQTNAKEKEYLLPTLLSKYGITNKIECRLITTGLLTTEKNPGTAKTENIFGLEPVEIGTKISLWEERKWIPKTSVIMHLGIPGLASKNYKAKHLAPSLVMTLQNSLTKNIALGYNLGVNWDGFSTTPNWTYTLAPGFNIGQKWYSYIEIFGSVAAHEQPEHSLDAGLAYFPDNNLKIDISAGKGISSSSPNWYMAIGFSCRLTTGK